MRKSRFIMQHSKNSLISSVGTAVAIGALLIGFGAGEQAKAADAVDAVCDKRFAIHEGGETLDLAYCANFDLKTGNSSFKRAVIVVHGNGRMAVDNFAYVRDAGIAADGADRTTAIVAPQFLTEEDINGHSLSKNVLFWSKDGWKIGDPSRESTGNPRPFTISSFKVLDWILERLADRQAYPGITEIVIVGHSAGGQFSQRYAAGGTAPVNLAAARPDLSFRYVVANPSSYLYFSPERAEQGTKDSFSIPDSKGCSWYNNYKYGLKNLNGYMAEVGADVIKQRYQSRRVVTLLGLEDNDPNSPDLATSCAAMFQGGHRLERGEIHFNHVQKQFGHQILDRHRLDYVPGVAHSSRQMFQSDCGLAHLYNFDPTGTACTEQVVFADSFENGLGNWTQDSQNDWYSSTRRDADGSHSAEVDGLANDAALISPQINLSGFGGASIQFSWYIETSLDAGEYLAFDVSTNDGRTWTEKARVKGGVDQPNFWHNVRIAVPGANSVKLRFRGKVSSSGEDLNVDNVIVKPLPKTVFSESFENGLGDWTQDSQNDWFGSSQRAADGNRSAEVDGRATDATLVSPEIALNGHGDATVGFSWYIESGLDSGEYLGFDVSTDGGQTWMEKARLKGNVDRERTWHDVRIDLPGVDRLMLRFRGKMSGSAEDANIDNVFVTFSPKQQVFADSFEDGLGDWVEDSQNDWFGSSQRAADGNRSAEVDGSATDATLVSPEIALNGYGDATVGFSWYIESGLDSGEYLGFDVSTDGGQTWIEKARLKGNVDQESTWHDVRIDLPGVDSLMLRFRGKMSGSAEDANIDKVFVTFSPKD